MKAAAIIIVAALALAGCRAESPRHWNSANMDTPGVWHGYQKSEFPQD